MTVQETARGAGRTAGAVAGRGRDAWRVLTRAIAERMPKGLYARSLLIVILPMLILQSVLTFVFLERHWQTVTRRLSAALSRDIAGVIAVIESYPQDPTFETITRIAKENLDLTISVLPAAPLPPPGPKPFFSILDRELSDQIRQAVAKPFWIDTVGRSDLLEIRVRLPDKVLRVFARRSQAYASNSHIFLLWMAGTALVLVSVAVLFLRNQIRPILQLADVAEGFGKGRPPPADFRPRGAQEVRRAAEAFQEMRHRIQRQIEQRTTMLAGVSHDLRTILTRFRLQLALLPPGPEIDALDRDVSEMQSMLEAYVAFARGDADEPGQPTDMAALLAEIQSETEAAGFGIAIRFEGEPVVTVRANAVKRLLVNLILNACRYGERVDVAGRHADGWLVVTVDDDGPGIPVAERENVFRPFYRLDQARNQDESGTGLGLAIARDIAHGHGGDIELTDSPLGGLRAIVRLPG